jgi:hypothetical protein
VPGIRRSPLAGAEPLSPRRKWRAITLATLLFVPAYWGVVAGLVSTATHRATAPEGGPYLAFGLALIPFVFIVLAFLSEHPRAAGAVLRAMVLSIVVGILASAVAQDGLTGIVAGVGAGGAAALRADWPHNWKARALAVGAASLYTFVLVRVAPDVALLAAPVLPFTGIGVADHLSERRSERAAADGTRRPPRGR